MPPTPPCVKLQVGSCHGKINYGPFETVFDGSKVRQAVKQAAREVRKSLQSRRLVDARSRSHRAPWNAATELQHKIEIRSIFSPMKRGEDPRDETRASGGKCSAAKNLHHQFGTTDSREFSSAHREYMESKGAPLWNVSTDYRRASSAASAISDETQSRMPKLSKKRPDPANYKSPIELEKEFAAQMRREKEIERRRKSDSNTPVKTTSLAEIKDSSQEEKLKSKYTPEALSQYLAEQEAIQKSSDDRPSTTATTASTKSSKRSSFPPQPTFKPAINHNIALPSHTQVTSEHRGAWEFSKVEGCHVWSCCLSTNEGRKPGCSVRKTVLRRVS